jgi:hypothetical protein
MKEQTDTTPPKSVAGPSTMSILRNASTSAKPPTIKGTSGGPPPKN